MLKKNNLTREEFNIIKSTANKISNARYASMHGNLYDELPSIIGLKLTNKCNLRCVHCYEWNEHGYHHNFDTTQKNMELEYSIVEKCIEETEEKKSSFYLWGGEPLVYGKIEPLLKKLAKHDRITAICTNGIKLLDYCDLLTPFGGKLELLIALDGMKQENDKIRGEGVYKKVVETINYLSELKKSNIFNGKLSVHTVISNDNITNFTDYIDEIDKTGIDNLIVCLPWYISKQTSIEMDNFYTENFHWLNDSKTDEIKSWHAFKYGIESDNINQVLHIIDQIKKYPSRMKIKLQPDITHNKMEAFIKGESIVDEQRKGCLSVFSRMDVLPDGRVSSCKHFPEFSVGNLRDASVKELWNSSDMNKIRNVLREKNMAVCSKCNNYYLHGYKSNS